MKYKYYYIIISTIILVCTGCKDANKIQLESIIDEFDYLKNSSIIEDQKLQDLKAKFENLSYSTTHDIQISALYYLSEISTMENKFKEAYDFINQAYKINHADSIYKKLKNLNNLLNPELDTLKKEHQKNDVEFKNIFEVGRNEIKKLYINKNYSDAINQTYILISMIKSLKKESKIKIELSQLYQDLSIFYSQQDKLDKAKEYIDMAILLNPTSENIEIQKLINKK